MALAPLRLVGNSGSAVSHPPAPHPNGQLGMVLQAMGLLSADELIAAQTGALQHGFSLNKFLITSGLVDENDMLRAQERARSIRVADLERHPPDTRLIDQFGASRCIKHGIVPWKSIGGATLVACCDPDDLEGVTIGTRPLIPVLATRTDILKALTRLRARQLVRRAEVRPDEDFSCRNWPLLQAKKSTCVAGLLALAWLIAGTASFATALLGWVLFTMAAVFAMKITATAFFLMKGAVREADQNAVIPIGKRPEVSILVALYREKEIARTLVRRLSELTYPKELLEIVLVVEASDHATRKTLDETDLPNWFKVVVVPKGTIKTKPRALNYALDFCRGHIIGVYDAEDAPEPDQIDKVVNRFLRSDDKTACLQGRLDYYNPRANWIARCFTIEYTTWFRVIMPGLQRMGWPLPLGGTTFFIRRDALENLGAWDAHNVTEDADLGMRLARFGYRTEMVDTVTYEEANCRIWPWVKQRSRWLKGFAVTYWVHMRHPRQLLRDFGPWRFIGIHVLFLATVSQFALAPILWSIWPAAFGLWFPFQGIIEAQTLVKITACFLGAELVSMGIAGIAVSPRNKRHLIPWIPMMMLYYPFATFAAIKGLYELRGRPFYWDKTRHGVSQPAAEK